VDAKPGPTRKGGLQGDRPEERVSGVVRPAPEGERGGGNGEHTIALFEKLTRGSRGGKGKKTWGA